jgi:hypothetical protein
MSAGMWRRGVFWAPGRVEEAPEEAPILNVGEVGWDDGCGDGRGCGLPRGERSCRTEGEPCAKEEASIGPRDSGDCVWGECAFPWAPNEDGDAGCGAL